MDAWYNRRSSIFIFFHDKRRVGSTRRTRSRRMDPIDAVNRDRIARIEDQSARQSEFPVIDQIRR